MKRFLILCAGIMAISSAAVADDSEFDETNVALFVEAGKDAIRARLKDPDSAQFDKVFHHHTKKYGHIVCGHVNAKNGYGGYMGYQNFITNTANVAVLQSDMEFKDFKASWKMFCLDK